MSIGTIQALLTAIMYRNSVPTVFNCRVGSQMATISFKQTQKQSKTNQLMRVAKTDLHMAYRYRSIRIGL